MLRLLTSMSVLLAPVRTRLRSEKGLEAIEYALLAALIAALIVAAIALLNPAMNTIFTAIRDQLTTAAGNINAN
jgi:Flp pilus assembly pilin Flp